MASYLWIQIVVIVGMSTFVLSRSFWESSLHNCSDIREIMAKGQKINNQIDVVRCISMCFDETTSVSVEVTPLECFNDLVKPYMTKVLQKQIPTEDEMKTCLNTKDRSECKDVLLYFFTKWYKDNYSTDHNKKFAQFLFNTWAHIPDVRQGMKFRNWERRMGLVFGNIAFDSDDDIRATIKITSPSDPLKYPVIQKELKRYCFQPVTDSTTKIFCGLRIVMNVAYKMYTLAKGKQNLSHNFEKYVEAIKANLIPFSALYQMGFSGSEEDKISILDEQLRELADLTRARDSGSMKAFLQFMPEPYLLEKVCKKEVSDTLTRRCCILEKVVEQLLVYSNMAEKRKENSNRKAVTINFSLNLRSVITELRGEEVFNLIADARFQDVSNQEETASLIEGKFAQLKRFFSDLQSFNLQKAIADVNYIKGRITYYKGKTDSVINDVSFQVGNVLIAAVTIKGGDVAEKGLKLVATIAQSCNPFDIVFDGGSVTDIMDALTELAEAIADLVEAVALQSALEGVIQTARAINQGFQKNSEFLSAVGRIVDKIQLTNFPDDDEFEQCKSTFLRLYNDYTPQVDKEMLAVLTTKLDTSVEAGCRIIDDASGAASNAASSVVKEDLICQTAATSTSSLQAIFEEIYDFQFELIENMASYLRSATGFHASEKMVTLTATPMIQNGNADERRSELRANIIMAHTTYEMQKQHAIQSLCDFIEYKEGGETIEVCKGSTTDVPILLSYIPKRCRSLNTFVSLPTSRSVNTPPGHLDLKKLYSGEDVSFDIPSYDWMKENDWIGQEDDFKAAYIRRFEIFMPTISSRDKRIQVTVKSMGGNRFHDQGIKYSLIPDTSFTTVYKVGTHLCSGEKIESPYSICEDRKLPKLCVISDVPNFNDERRLYPSTFARFKVTSKGINASQTPDPQTPLDIKARINMCVFDKEVIGTKRASQPSKPGCCSGNHYWSKTKQACESCTNGSKSNLNGYYCEKNQHALSQRRKKKSS